MKVGIFLGHGLPESQAGGAFTFQESILEALGGTKNRHTFYFFSYGAARMQAVNGGMLVPLMRYATLPYASMMKKCATKVFRSYERFSLKKYFKSFLQRAVHEHQIDVMWFMTPAYEYVDIPYFYTVWDLQHRRQSFFPEVSVTGSLYEEREHHYQTVIPQATYVITGNATGKKEIMQFYGVPDERVKVIPLPTPSFALRAVPSDETLLEKYGLAGVSYFFYPAQFWPHKNHICLLRALKLLYTFGFTHYHVVFTGADKGNLAYVKKYAKDLGIEGQVHFLGFVTQQELRLLYQHAQALLFPSFFGPDNIPPLEAGALGCPIITADVAGAREQLDDAALFFNPVDEHALAEKIMLLNKDDALRIRLIEKGQQHAYAFTADHYIQNIIALLDEFELIRRCWSSDVRYIHL